MPRPLNLTGYSIVVVLSVATGCIYIMGNDSGDLKRLAELNLQATQQFLKAPHGILEIEFLSHSVRGISQ
jgi:hypothetical protein